jgi:hypothetical protein
MQDTGVPKLAKDEILTERHLRNYKLQTLSINFTEQYDVQVALRLQRYNHTNNRPGMLIERKYQDFLG